MKNTLVSLFQVDLNEQTLLKPNSNIDECAIVKIQNMDYVLLRLL